METLTIVHTADLHGRLNRRVAEALHRLKADRGAVLLDSGDWTALPNILAVPWAPPVTRLMAVAGYDAAAMGNREWFFRSWGVRWLAAALPCPLVATNVRFRGNAGVVSSAIVQAPSGPVAVLAAARRMVPRDSVLEALCDYQYLDPREAIEQAVAAVWAKARWVIVLSHLGLVGDLEIAQVDGVDVVLGGHDHILTPSGLRAGGATVVHSGYYGRWATVVCIGRRGQGVEVAAVRLEDLPRA